MVGWSMNDELENVWKDAVMPWWKYHPFSYVEELRKIPQSSVCLASISAKIRIEYLLNMSLDRYRYAIPLGFTQSYKELS